MTTTVTKNPIVSEDVSFFLLDNEAIVFSEKRQELHALNTTGAFIWCCFGDGLSIAATVLILQNKLNLTKSDAKQYVAQTLVDWHAAGLFEGSEDIDKEQEPAKKKPAPSVARFSPQVRPDFQVAETQYYKILGTYFAVYAQLPEQFRWFATVFGHVTVEGPVVNPVIMDITHDGSAHILNLEDSPPWRLASLAEIAPAAMGLLFEKAIDLCPHLVSLHAAAVVHRGRALLLPGAGGSGKSSLALALYNAGFDYLSDDTILIDDTSLAIKGVPFSICIKEGGVEVASSIDNSVETIPILSRADGKRVRYLRPPAWPGLSDPYPLGWIVFPHYKAGCKMDLRPIGKVNALERLVKLCYLGPYLNTTRITKLIELLEPVDCYEMQIDRLEDAVSRLTKLVD